MKETQKKNENYIQKARRKSNGRKRILIRNIIDWSLNIIECKNWRERIAKGRRWGRTKWDKGKIWKGKQRRKHVEEEKYGGKKESNIERKKMEINCRPKIKEKKEEKCKPERKKKMQATKENKE